MSHFAILVVSADPSEETLTSILAPFYEQPDNEDDPAAVKVDVTDEWTAEFNSPDTTETKVKLADGSIVPPRDKKFYREPTEEELTLLKAHAEDHKVVVPFDYSSQGWAPNTTYKVYQLPEGAEKVEVQVKDLYKTMTEWAEGYHGGFTEDGDKVYQIRAKDPKWDWWVVGGRWRNLLMVKEGVVGVKGKPGVPEMMAISDAVQKGEPLPEEPADLVDQCQKKDLNLEKMRESAVQGRTESVNAVYRKIKAKALEKDPNTEPPTDEQITAKWQEFIGVYLEAKTEWEKTKPGQFWVWLEENYPVIKDAKETGLLNIGPWGFFDIANVPETELDPFAWAQRAPALSLYAFVDRDGKWLSKGEMGWFGMSSGEQDRNSWEDQFMALLADVKDDEYVSVVDCHI